MNFKQLLWKVKFEDVKNQILKLYPDQENFIDNYKHVFNKLKSEPIHDQKIDELIVLDISLIKNKDEEIYWDVSGLKPNSDKPKQHLSIEFTPWNKWLKFEIQESQLENLSKEEYIAHCLFEMTFFGFDEQKINEVNEILEKHITKIRKGTLKTCSWDDFKNSLESFIESDDDE